MALVRAAGWALGGSMLSQPRGRRAQNSLAGRRRRLEKRSLALKFLTSTPAPPAPALHLAGRVHAGRGRRPSQQVAGAAAAGGAPGGRARQGRAGEEAVARRRARAVRIGGGAAAGRIVIAGGDNNTAGQKVRCMEPGCRGGRHPGGRGARASRRESEVHGGGEAAEERECEEGERPQAPGPSGPFPHTSHSLLTARRSTPRRRLFELSTHTAHAARSLRRPRPEATGREHTARREHCAPPPSLLIATPPRRPLLSHPRRWEPSCSPPTAARPAGRPGLTGV